MKKKQNIKEQSMCPKCLGTKEVFNFVDDVMEKCTFCFGKGNVEADRADKYDPIDIENYMYKEEENE